MRQVPINVLNVICKEIWKRHLPIADETFFMGCKMRSLINGLIFLNLNI
jgi:hypothetical protein